MSALGGGLNRSTQHSISFYLLGFEPQGLARTAGDAKVPGFSAAVKPRKNPRRFVTHSVFPLQDRECCVDRLNRPLKADICTAKRRVRFTPESRHSERKSIRVMFRYLSRARERLHSAIPNRLGSARRGKKFDQSFRTFNVS